VAEEAVDEPQYETCKELLHHESLLRRRVARQLLKLSASQQAAIRAKFFRNQSLNLFSTTAGYCDSRDRTAWWRGKAKLKTLLTPQGFAQR